MELPPPTPLTLHVTLVLEAPITVAVNCWVPPVITLDVLGDTKTAIGWGCDAEPDPPQPPQAVIARSRT